MRLRYNIAKAALNGKLAVSDEVFGINEEALRFSRKVNVTLDTEIDADYPRKLASNVTVQLQDDMEYSQRVDYCKGDPENPMSLRETAGKFRLLTQRILSPQVSEAISGRIRNLRLLKDVGEHLSP
jgi:2-methylcitrate dehydratase PrpD